MLEQQKTLRLVLQRIPSESNVTEQHHFAHRLLEQMLQEQGIAPPYVLQKGKHGKPFLAYHPDIQINLSHCKGAVLCGIGDMPLGTCDAACADGSRATGSLASRATCIAIYALLDMEREFCKSDWDWNFLSDAADFLFSVTADSTGISYL